MSEWLLVRAVLAQEPEDWSRWAHIFACHGQEGTVQTDEPPSLSAYLPPAEHGQFEALRADLLAAGASRVESELVPEEDWAEGWKQFFHPVRIGNQIVVRPSWEEADLRPGDLEIVLDPGQAFGTGDHPTTKGCLILLEGRRPAGLDVADIGSGSGILSIAAAKLGAKRVVAVDSDPVSVESSQENAARNQVVVHVRVGLGFDPIANDETFDLVLSNIISAALIRLAPEASRRVRPGGRWIVSGIIRDNWAEVQAAAARVGFRVEEELLEGDWIAASLVR